MDVPDALGTDGVRVEDLPTDWRFYPAPPVLRDIGTGWAELRQTVVLQVPSAVVLGEHNFLLNPRHPDFGKRDNPTVAEHLTVAIDRDLESAGVEAAAVERGYVGNFAGELFINQGHMGALVAGLKPEFARKPFTRVEGACASGGLAVVACVDAIQAGHDIVLACGGEIQTTANARIGADYLARAADYATEREIDDFTFPCLFARRAKTSSRCSARSSGRKPLVFTFAFGRARSISRCAVLKSPSTSTRRPPRRRLTLAPAIARPLRSTTRPPCETPIESRSTPARWPPLRPPKA